MSINRKYIRRTGAVFNMAYNEAKKSPCNFKLGAVITKGRRKVICRGHNSNMRTKYLDKVSCCQHAEMAVATKFIHTHVRPRHYKVSTASP